MQMLATIQSRDFAASKAADHATRRSIDPDASGGIGIHGVRTAKPPGTGMPR
jgi:hypothetical protein